MDNLSQNKILVTGASGFIGKHLVEHLLRRGFDVRCLVRRQVHLPTPEGATGRLETALGDINDPPSLTEALSGVHTVVHLVGIIRETPGATFQRIHVDGTRNLLIAAARAEAKRFFYMSGLGARPNARSRYHQTKWEAEELVRASGLQLAVFRPS
ncbi:MAG: SDR family oxidoreductase, partial [Armatimonadota bacterium]